MSQENLLQAVANAPAVVEMGDRPAVENENVIIDIQVPPADAPGPNQENAPGPDQEADPNGSESEASAEDSSDESQPDQDGAQAGNGDQVDPEAQAAAPADPPAVPDHVEPYKSGMGCGAIIAIILSVLALIAFGAYCYRRHNAGSNGDARLKIDGRKALQEFLNSNSDSEADGELTLDYDGEVGVVSLNAQKMAKYVQDVDFTLNSMAAADVTQDMIRRASQAQKVSVEPDRITEQQYNHLLVTAKTATQLINKLFPSNKTLHIQASGHASGAGEVNMLTCQDTKFLILWKYMEVQQQQKSHVSFGPGAGVVTPHNAQGGYGSTIDMKDFKQFYQKVVEKCDLSNTSGKDFGVTMLAFYKFLQSPGCNFLMG